MGVNKELKFILAKFKEADRALERLNTSVIDDVVVYAELGDVEQKMQSAWHRYDDKVKFKMFKAKESKVRELVSSFSDLVYKYNNASDRVLSEIETSLKSKLESGDADAQARLDRVADKLKQTADDYMYQAEIRVREIGKYFRDTTQKQRNARNFASMSTELAMGAVAVGLATSLAVGGVHYTELKNNTAEVRLENETYKQQLAEKDEYINSLLQNGGAGVSQEAYDQLLNEYNALKGKYDSLMLEYNEYLSLIPEGQKPSAYIQGLVAQVEEYNTKISALEIQIGVLKATNLVLKNEIVDLKIENADLKAQRDEALAGNDSELVASLTKKLEENEKKLGEATKKNAEYEKTIADMESSHATEVAGYKSTIEKLEAELKSEKDKNADLTTENEGLKSENGSLKSENEALKMTEEEYSEFVSMVNSLYASIVGGSETEPLAQLQAISSAFDYYADLVEQGGLTAEQEDQAIANLIAAFVSCGIDYSEISHMNLTQIAEWFNAKVNAYGTPAEGPNGNVHENGTSSSTPSGGNNSGSGESEKEEGDGTGNISGDLPVRGDR